LWEINFYQLEDANLKIAFSHQGQVAKLYNNEKTNAIFLSDVKKVFLYIKKGLYKKMNTSF